MQRKNSTHFKIKQNLQVTIFRGGSIFSRKWTKLDYFQNKDANQFQFTCILIFYLPYSSYITYYSNYKLCHFFNFKVAWLEISMSVKQIIHAL